MTQKRFSNLPRPPDRHRKPGHQYAEENNQSWVKAIDSPPALPSSASSVYEGDLHHLRPMGTAEKKLPKAKPRHR